MGIFREFKDALALASESPFLLVLGLVAASLYLLHWVRKNAAPRLRDQKRARVFGRVLETARALEEVGEMQNLTEEQKASFLAAIIENGEGLPQPESSTEVAPEPQDDREVAVSPPPPWFLDRIEKLVDSGGELLLGIGALGLGSGCILMAYEIVTRKLDFGAAFLTVLFSTLSVMVIVAGLRVIAGTFGVKLTFIDEAEAYLQAKLTPPDWVYVVGVLLFLSAKYVFPAGLFVVMLRWCIANPNADVGDWTFTIVVGMFAVGMTVKAAQKLRAVFYLPDEDQEVAESPAAS